VIAAPEVGTDAQCCRHAIGGEDVLVGVGVSPELDLLAHVIDANSRRPRWVDIVRP
jgi:hypothetical protein